MDHANRLKRLKFRAWHRGTKEADLLIGGFFDRFSAEWTEDEADWFEALLEIDDVTIMAWAIGTETPPAGIDGAMMRRMQELDYIPIAK
ncbi:succinate dehydrogenase assembly factor 2 [Parasphingopyxis algicola]|uniref:FAD assembly factor SdhE n=1 Tax=Parasphingopyxis algicola TaxID=2026624 RepID=UPI0015A47453|nr:succinate dehydrogenase assembly factor 2 [Parasphingopyxis algicola]QLC24241.1 succinate dehydrogenase assembly factor 2 [Parasphingopyxis algicola]